MKLNSIFRTLCLVALMCITSVNAYAYKNYERGNITLTSGNDKILVVTQNVTVDIFLVNGGYALVILPGVEVTVNIKFDNNGTIYVFGKLSCNAISPTNYGTINITEGGKSNVSIGTINDRFDPLQKVPAKAPTSTQSGWVEYWEARIVCGEDYYIEGYYRQYYLSNSYKIEDLESWKANDGKLEYNTPTKIDGQMPNAENGYVGWKDYYKQICTANTGSEYTFYAEDEEFTKPITDLEAWKTGEGLKCGVVMGEQCYILEKQDGEFVLGKDITFNDKDAYFSKYNFTVNRDITYSRTFKNTQWQPLYVPFAISHDDWERNFDVATINNFHEYTDDEGNTVKTELEVRLVKSGTLKPNHPYLIRAKVANTNAPQSIEISSKKICTSEENSNSCSSMEEKYTFTGTYKEITGMKSNGYIFLSDGKLCMATSDDVKLGAQRWYLKIEPLGSQIIDDESGSDAAKAFSFDIKLLDDEVTGIDEITVTRTPLKNNSNALYNLNGMRVNSVGNGFFIKDGKTYYYK